MWETILHPFAVAISYVWVWIHNLLSLIGFGSGSGIAWVISIVLLTLVVRALILPLFLKQIKSSRGMQAMQPELKKLQEKYKGKTDQLSRQRMMEEQQELYKKHGTNPLASCLPMLVQIPILFAMYRAIFGVKDIAAGTYTYQGESADSLGAITQSIAQEINSSTVLGVPLSSMFSEADGVSGKIAFIIIIAIMVVLQFLSMQISLTRNMPTQSDPNNPMVRSQKMMLYMMPGMFIVTGFFFQMGLLIYMVTSAAWAWGQSLWTIRYMPTPGSPAYEALVSQRQKAYHEWARPFFADYDRERAGIAASDTASLDALTERTVAELKKRGAKNHIVTNFPVEMTQGEVLSVYRTLSTQEWDTLPDSMWMRAIHRATERNMERRAQQEAREQNKRLSREQRRAQQGQQKDTSGESAQASSRGGAGNLTPDEIERRRQARRKAARNKAKKKRN